MTKSLYEILNVTEKSSQDEIKKAYRQLSLKYHPDKNPGNPEVVGKFQEISEAYETLGNEEKRQQYDMMQKNPFARMNSNMGSNNMSGGVHHVNVEDLFNNFFNMGGMGGGFPGMPGMHGMPGMGEGTFPGGPQVHVFRNGMPVNINRAMQKPTPIIKTITINMEQVMVGANVPVEIERWSMEEGSKNFEKETIYVNIPKGVDDNEIIIMREKGNIISETCKGDIKLFVKIENNTEFKRNGLDIILEKKVSLKDALCGFHIEIKHINGKKYTINNNPGSIVTPDYFKSIPNMGLTRGDHTGNLVITFHVIFPETLNTDQINKLKNIL